MLKANLHIKREKHQKADSVTYNGHRPGVASERDREREREKRKKSVVK